MGLNINPPTNTTTTNTNYINLTTKKNAPTNKKINTTLNKSYPKGYQREEYDDEDDDNNNDRNGISTAGLTPAARKAAIQEKNRRAQRRFRERQRTRVAELEEQVAELRAEMAVLAGGKKAAEARLMASHYHHHHYPTDTATATATAVLNNNNITNSANTTTAATATTSLHLDSGASLFEGVAQFDDDDVVITLASLQQEQQHEQEYNAAAPPQVTSSVTATDGTTTSIKKGVALSASQIKSITPSEMSKLYEAYVHELAAVLVEGENNSKGLVAAGTFTADASTAAVEVGRGGGGRMDQLVHELLLLITRFSLCNPSAAKQFSFLKLDDPLSATAEKREMEEEEEDEYRRNEKLALKRLSKVTNALQLTPAQRTAMVQLRRTFSRRLTEIAQAREASLSLLATAAPPPPSSSLISNRQAARQWLKAQHAAESIRQLMREEHVLTLDLISTVTKKVLSSRQMAHLLIHSFPFTPDFLSVCTWVASEEGDAESLMVLYGAKCWSDDADKASARVDYGVDDAIIEEGEEDEKRRINDNGGMRKSQRARKSKTILNV